MEYRTIVLRFCDARTSSIIVSPGDDRSLAAAISEKGVRSSYSVAVAATLDGRVEAVSQQSVSCGASFISRS